MMPFISVILPIYNAEKYLNRCIDSIVNQTYRNLQIILIDDGSTDSSGNICDEYAKLDDRITVIHKENSGVADSRNRGLDIARGNYIGFVDADDYIELTMYERLYKTIVLHDADVCCCGYIQEYEKHFVEKCSEAVVEYSECISIMGAYLRQDKYAGIGDGNWNKLFKRETIGSCRYIERANGEDIFFQFEIFSNCHKLVCIPELLYHYVSNDESASNGHYTKSKESILDIADEILKIIATDYEELTEQTYAFHLTWYISLLQHICIKDKSEDALECRKRIRDNLKTNFKFYYRNKYSKRLDQYYLLSEVFRITPMAVAARTIVRRVKPSKDKITYAE